MAGRDIQGDTAIQIAVNRAAFQEDMDMVLSMYSNPSVSLSFVYLGEMGVGPGVTRDAINLRWQAFYTANPPVWRCYNSSMTTPDFGTPVFPHHKIRQEDAYVMGILIGHTLLNVVTPSAMICPVLWELLVMSTAPSSAWRNEAFKIIDPVLAGMSATPGVLVDSDTPNHYDGDTPFVGDSEYIMDEQQAIDWFEKARDVTCGTSFWIRVIKPLRSGINEVIDTSCWDLYGHYGIAKAFGVDNADCILKYWNDIEFTGGFTATTPVVQWLKEFLADAGAPYNRCRALLIFWTGESMLPSDGLVGIHPRPTIGPSIVSTTLTSTGAPPAPGLPSSATCTRFLKVPNYHAREELFRMFDMALQDVPSDFQVA